MRHVPLLAGLVSAALLVGCVNPYEKFYRGKPDGRSVDNYVPSSEPLQVFSSSNFAQDIAAMESRGYAPIGQSNFNGASNKISERQLRDEAAKLNAAAVLVASRYTGTVTGAMPLVLPHNSTSYTTGNATVSGMGGIANVNGSATTTTYGTETLMVPYSVQRADFAAIYFVRVRPHFGAFYGTIDEPTRARLQTNAGVMIGVIVEGSPAAHADILPGDIVLTLDGARVDGGEDLSSQMRAHFGQEVVLGVDRNGQRLEKKVTLPP